MKIRTLFYTIVQGVRNIFRNKWFSLASIATISACLLLFGVFYSLVMNLRASVQNLQRDFLMTVFFDEGTTYDRMSEIGEMIDKREEVARYRFLTDDEAWEEYQETFEEGYGDGFIDNPLEGLAQYRIYLKDAASEEEMRMWLESIADVSHVNTLSELADILNGINRLVSYVSAGIIAILLAVSVFLIRNTVAIGISVRKEEINIMKYVGATDFFVRFPFVLEGIFIGLIGTALPLFLLYQGYQRLIDFLTARFSSLSNLLTFISVTEIFKVLVPVSLCVGVGIGFMGSITAVRKHLRV
jgi:cell division transport system permease protein